MGLVCSQPADLPIGSLAPFDVGDLGREEIAPSFPAASEMRLPSLRRLLSLLT